MVSKISQIFMENTHTKKDLRFDPTTRSTPRLGNVDKEKEGEEDRSGHFGNLVVGNGVVRTHAVRNGRR